jgi:hypothetical protein
MPKYLVAIHHSIDFDRSNEGPEVMKDIDDLNDEMEAAGVRQLAMGLKGPDFARSLRSADTGIQETAGLYLGGPEYVGGFWILNCANIDEAVGWGRKAVVACRANVEVREFH